MRRARRDHDDVARSDRPRLPVDLDDELARDAGERLLLLRMEVRRHVAAGADVQLRLEQLAAGVVARSQEHPALARDRIFDLARGVGHPSSIALSMRWLAAWPRSGR